MTIKQRVCLSVKKKLAMEQRGGQESSMEAISQGDDMLVELPSQIQHFPTGGDTQRTPKKDRGIKFVHEASQERINFLDLTIIKDVGGFKTITYFKQTDRSAFIPLDSCHNKSWLKSIPKSQFVRMRRNCSEMEDYRFQVDVLENRLHEKDYDLDPLEVTIEEVAKLDRSTLLDVGPKEKKEGPILRFITMYLTQLFLIKKIIRKHWHLLGNDRIINTFLPANPQVIFKGILSLRDRIAPNIVDPPTKRLSFFQNLSGYHQCRRCQVCTLNKSKTRRTESFISTSTSREHKIEPFVTCSSTGVVYLLQCPCGLQYIGRTKRSMQVHLGEHIANIKISFKYHSVSKHYDMFHNLNPANTLFMVIDKYSAHWRGAL